jgi:ApeA N-terminal domain 1
MQAFEILHRRLFGGTYVTKDEWQPSYQALVKAIPDSLASDHRESLKMRLHYGFEISLRKRLTLILRGLEERTRSLITAGDPRFVEQCVETRNGLTHEGSGSLLTEGLEALWRVNRRIRALVTCLIWRELGLSEERIMTEIFSRVRP